MAFNDPIVACCGRDAADCDCPTRPTVSLAKPLTHRQYTMVADMLVKLHPEDLINLISVALQRHPFGEQELFDCDVHETTYYLDVPSTDGSAPTRPFTVSIYNENEAPND